MLPYGNGTDARSASAMRNAKRLVKIEMRNVAAKLSRLRQSHQRVEIGPVNIDLATHSAGFSRKPS